MNISKNWKPIMFAGLACIVISHFVLGWLFWIGIAFFILGYFMARKKGGQSKSITSPIVDLIAFISFIVLFMLYRFHPANLDLTAFAFPFQMIVLGCYLVKISDEREMAKTSGENRSE